MIRTKHIKKNEMDSEYLKLLTSRMQLASLFSKTHNGKRDIYTACGWPDVITFWDYYNRYKRQGIARRVVNAPVSATWRGKPVIEETDTPGQETAFEKALADLIIEHDLYKYCSRLDKMAGIGEFAIMFLGLSGQDNLEEEVKKTKANKLLYLSVYHQGNCEVKYYEEDANNPRFGLPKLYEIDFSRSSHGTSRRGPVNLGKKLVHYSRIIHAADDLLEGEIFASPRLEPVWNNLISLELITGGSGETYWRGAFPGFAFSADPDAEFGPNDKEEFVEQIENYMHDFQRYLRLRGINVQQLSPQISDPSPFIETQLIQIAATTGIPMRILTGSERGELASTQDQENWQSRVDERRREFAEPVILKSTIDRLIDVQVLPVPKNGYEIQWPDINALSEEAQTAIDAKLIEIAAKYVGTPGMDVYLPPEIFLRDFMKFDENTIGECLKSIENTPRPDEGEDLVEPEEEELDEVVTNVKSLLRFSNGFNKDEK